ncbi:G-type lectin S-receptor-like serine/threonine-protein kinase RLK1 [Cucumis melo var. makuwa]|uniref:Receptor-like serine/threonine-protein kinase n=1 Tax=Cucumis melo var. makuwa TaxID=1194695 RepID=A0A5D3BD62_CUCMM|nr:G-type lectin S-receptor-like serine/threonine-protein kinase RLK1 [Cucumis melo var. makuwa]
MASHQNSFFFFFLFLFLFLPSFSVSAQPYKNVTLGSSLTALNNNNDSYWSSLSGDFAFGFLQFESKGFLLAIWFNKIPQKTVVWSAKPSALVPEGSSVQLTYTQLVLKDPAGKQIWSSNNNNDVGLGSVSYAAILDSGNFILTSTDSQVLWQSFDHPTDTILPSQTLNSDLVSSYSQTNYTEGRFLFSMKTDGNLVSSYPRTIPMRWSPFIYWESKTSGSGFNLVFNLSGSIYISAPNGSVVKNLSSNTPSTDDFYHRAVFEYDGVFRQYVYPKTTKITGNATPSPWPEDWSQVSVSIPSNMCLPITNGLGSGACGYNSYCSLGDDRRPTCHCPQGYDMLDPNDAFHGCKPIFTPQSCDDEETDAFEFFSIENSDWPDGDYEAFSGVNEDWCRRVCLDDCYCSAVIFKETHCWKKKFPLSFGRIDLEFEGKALIKVRKQNSTSILVNQAYKKVKDKTLVLVGSIFLGTCGFLIATLLIAYQFNIKRTKLLIEKNLPVLQGMNLRIFSYEELHKATTGFTEQLGSGAFATVYKGVIDDCMDKEKNLVAVKKLENMVKEGDQEFKAEVSAIARTNHKNLVQLLGFCNEEPHRMLVYEYMNKGSLADYLFGCSKKPNWYERIEVILGTARGLCYLHEECETQIIHCDIKPQNILLDDSLVARISDFGLAKLLKKNQTRTMTGIRGTKGYVAPEWFRNLAITAKVDVYSFGIVLLEIISCRKSLEVEGEDELMVLADMAYDCFQERKVEMLVKNDEEAKQDMKRVEKFVKIGIWCIQEEPSFRPSMRKVVQMLEGAVAVSTPPHPSSFITAIH